VGAPRDPLYAEGVAGLGPAAGQWYLRAPTDEVRSSLNIEPAWAITAGRPDIVVAVVDTGVRYEHPDLLAVSAGGNLLPGYDMISQAEMANDGDARDPDPSDPGDWVSQADLSSRGSFFRCAQGPETSSWHGTQVSGLVAALTDNGLGMAGAAPGVHILPVRALGKCGGFDSDIIAAMRWAAGLEVPGVPANPTPARVINLSLGGDGACSVAYQEAVDQITANGTLIVAAAGNSSGHAVGVPADCRGVLAVAGLRHAGTKVGYSSLGSEVAISAPGGNCVNNASGSACLYPILTTSDSGTTAPAGPTYTDSYTTSLGTSFSAPLVSGVAALALSVNPALTPPQVRDLLQATARPFPAVGSIAASSTVAQCTAPQYSLMGRALDQGECYCTTNTCGAGMLDAGAALAAAVGSAEASGRDRP
jgi:serine protease